MSTHLPAPAYAGPVECLWCKRPIRAAEPGHEQEPASHGLHPEVCAPAYRAWAGLPPEGAPKYLGYANREAFLAGRKLREVQVCFRWDATSPLGLFLVRDGGAPLGCQIPVRHAEAVKAMRIGDALEVTAHSRDVFGDPYLTPEGEVAVEPILLRRIA
jgi:hypothetical protein